MLSDCLDCFASVRRFRNDLACIVLLQHVAKYVTNDWVVIGQNDANRPRLGRSSTCGQSLLLIARVDLLSTKEADLVRFNLHSRTLQSFSRGE